MTATPGSSAGEAATTSFEGRGDELSRLERAVGVAGSGRTQMVYVEGPAGIGKTRFAEEIERIATADGFQSAAAKVQELEFGRPFAPIATALGCAPDDAGDRRATIGRLLADGDAPESRIVDLLLDLIEEDAAEQPLLMRLDDLHWADRSTLATLAAIQSRLEFAPLLVVATLRPLPRRPDLERLVRAAGEDAGHRIDLGPLSNAEVAAMVSNLVGGAPGPRLLESVGAAGGNPFFVLELVSALAEEGRIAGGDGVSELQGTGAPGGLGTVLTRRLDYLGDRAFELLRVAAVLGDEMSVDELAAVTGRPTIDLMAAIEELLEAGLLEERGSALAFRHDLIREAVYSELPAPVRAGLHLECGDALAAAGAASSRIAQQYAMAPPPATPERFQAILQGVADAAQLSPSGAAELMQRALELLPPGLGEERPRHLARLALLRGGAGDRAGAESAAREAIESGGVPPPEAWEALVQSLFGQGRWTALIDAAGEGLSAPLDATRRGRILAWRGLAHLWTGDLEAARSDCEDALEAGWEAGDDVAITLAHSHLGGVSSVSGNYQGGLEHGERAVQAARSLEAQRHAPHIGLVFDQMDCCLWDDAIAGVTRAREMIDRNGADWARPMFHVARAVIHYLTGEWDDALAEAEAGLGHGVELRGEPPGLAATHGLIATIAVHRDELGRAEREVAAGMEIVEREGPQWGIGWLQRAAAEIALISEGPEEALEIALEGWRQLEGMDGAKPFVAVQLAELAIAAERDELAREALEMLERLAARPCAGPQPANATFVRALLDEDGDAFEEAAAQYDELGLPLEAARAREEAAVHAASAGREEAAGALLDRALELYARLGAARHEARAMARGRAANLIRGRRGSRGRPATGWDSLTPSELKVTELAAAGLTNPQIGERLYISRRTVQTHLSHVFRKLGLSSRVELAAAVSSPDSPLSGD